MRIPAAANRATIGRNASAWPATSSPPSVVTSVRFSGTMQQACGRVASAMASLPAAVQTQGVVVQQKSTAILGIVVLFVSGAALWSRRWAAKRSAAQRLDKGGEA